MAEMSKPQELETQKKGGDIESGAAGTGGGALYPKMTEDPRLRWAFIRKVYSILTAQFLFTAGVAAAMTFIRPIPDFVLSHTPASWAAYFGLLLSPLIVLWPMLHYRERHPVNLFWLALFTLCTSLSIGVVSATLGGRALLQAVILTATILVALTIYTFWAVRKGHDFAFLYPFLFSCLLVLLVFLIIQQLCFPLTKIARAIYGCVASVVFSAFIVYDTDNLIKRHTYDQYICAAISLYLDVINLFISLLTFSAAVE
ncbi:protein LIFEGUARD 2-like isoform X1 [Phoenix dactylifera]|uniref:Protein LIFEGUARD 2-like isoform X1 n=1 Tax=Phoenix dactylifera TaxID=42345 RepID=A0A8B9A3A8_PHODC|nr:protein LIFEGUARD 2-like isoform X1 [Phoenix dactylifera]